MTKQEFQNLLKKGPLILDGATGSNLRLMGMPAGVCTEKWVNEHPEVIQKLQKAYVDAGSMVVYAPTFMANRISLKNVGLEEEVRRLNLENVKISKDAVGDKALVAGNLSTTSQPLEPIGTMTYEALLENYKEQISYLAEAGVDYLAAETLLSLEEAMVICDAAAEVCDLPLTLSFTCEGDGSPIGPKVHVDDATYDFSSDLRKFQWGLDLGGEWRAYKHLSVYADLTWGLNAIFPDDFKSITFKMYNVYLNFGFGYVF